jgi:hypothetical protein
MLADIPIGDPTPEDYARLRAMPEADYAERLQIIRRYFLVSTRPEFDGERAEVEVTFPEMEAALASSPDERAFPGHAARLSGRVPDAAREFSYWNSRSLGVTILRIQREDWPGVYQQTLKTGEESAPFSLLAPPKPTSRARVALQFVVHGFEHILPLGIDHILFVLGLFLLSPKLGPLLWQVTAFTVAHTVTLGLSMNGIVSLPPSIVEPLIALSIAYVAVENVMTTNMKPWRLAVVFAFGLLHGMGFAGALGELGLPPERAVTALVGFNVGVELGQLAVIGLAFLAVGWFRHRAWYRPRMTIPASCAIALIGLYWTVERIVS